MVDKHQSEVSSSRLRPPIVVVLGHVDHGKTTLLDSIRKSNVTAKESGGITQHIGAYQVTVSQKGEQPSRATEGSRRISSKLAKPGSQGILPRQPADQDDRAGEIRTITFIDTPGHEAFVKMRSRGAQVADIAVLVVAANDGVMPQTEEAITHIKEAGIPFIVALNKTDLPEADPQKVKQQLARVGILVEGFGGEVVLVPISAKGGQGIPELLEMILLIAQLKELRGDPKAPLSGVVIEARLDKSRGPVTTVIVKDGQIAVGQTVFAEDSKARVRALMDDQGNRLSEALPGSGVEVMGWEKVPAVGARISAEVGRTQVVSPTNAPTPYSFTLPPLSDEVKLKLLLKTDVVGTLEAIKESVKKDVVLVASGIGEINESDVLMAKPTGALIVGFHVQPTSRATTLAKVENVRIKTYTTIYQLLDEIREVVELLKTPEAREELLGEGVVIAQFSVEQTKVAGCRIQSGRLARGDTVKLLRENQVILHARIKSLRHGKEDITQADKGQECGLAFDKKLDFKVGDLIIAYKKHQLLG